MEDQVGLSPGDGLIRRLQFSDKTPKPTPAVKTVPLTNEPAPRKMKVLLRIRPIENMKKSVIDLVSDTTARFTAPKESEAFKHGKNSVRYEFTKVLPSTSSQKEVYDTSAKHLVGQLMDGENGLVFAYGITNSGKTYTIDGVPTERGIVHRALQDVIEKIADRKELSLTISYMEIYNEKIFDLLEYMDDQRKVTRKPLKILHDQFKEVYVQNLKQAEVKNLRDALNIIQKGGSFRQMAHTKVHMESVSSRSHVVFTITLHKNKSRYAKLSIVDLAGAERVNRSGCTSGTQKQELININKSLMNLGRCLEGLRHNQTHSTSRPIPFRDSLLTFLFKDSLLGDGETVMIATANPHPNDYDETVHAMRYTSIASEIKILAKVKTHQKLRATRPRIAALSTVKKKHQPHASQESIASPASASSHEGLWEVIEEKEERITELLDKVYQLKKQMVKMEAKRVESVQNAREETSKLFERQIEEMESEHETRMEEVKKNISELYERKMIIRQRQHVREKQELSSSSHSEDQTFEEKVKQILNLESALHDRELKSLKDSHDKEIKQLRADKAQSQALEKGLQQQLKEMHESYSNQELEQKSKVAKLEGKVSLLSTQLESIKSSQNQKQMADRDAYQTSITDKTKQIKNLEAQLQASNDQIIQIRSEIAKMEAEHLRKIKAIGKMSKDKTEKMAKELSKKEDIEKKLRQQLEEALSVSEEQTKSRNLKIQALTAEVKKRKTEEKRLQELVKEQEKRLEEGEKSFKAKIVLLEKKIGEEGDFQKKAKNAEEELKHSMAAVEEKASSLAEAEAQIKALKKQIAKEQKAHTKQKKSHETVLKRAQEELKALQDECASLEQKLEQEQMKLKASEELVKETEAEVQQLKDAAKKSHKREVSFTEPKKQSDMMAELKEEEHAGDGDAEQEEEERQSDKKATRARISKKPKQTKRTTRRSRRTRTREVLPQVEGNDKEEPAADKEAAAAQESVGERRTEEDEETEKQSSEEAEPVKKLRRGRRGKRKESDSTEVAAASESKVEEKELPSQQQQRRRRRKKTVSVNDLDDENVFEFSSKSKPKPRQRRKTRSRNALPAEETATVQAKEEDPTENTGKDSYDVAPEEKQEGNDGVVLTRKRGRGRPRKKKTETNILEKEEEEEENEAPRNPNTTNAKQKPPKRRTRGKRKTSSKDKALLEPLPTASKQQQHKRHKSSSENLNELADQENCDDGFGNVVPSRPLLSKNVKSQISRARKRMTRKKAQKSVGEEEEEEEMKLSLDKQNQTVRGRRPLRKVPIASVEANAWAQVLEPPAENMEEEEEEQPPTPPSRSTRSSRRLRTRKSVKYN